jgi:hypothetical protein
MAECGIYYSTSSDMKNAVKVPAVKQSDGSYLVTLPEFKAGSVYYYKTYTIDKSQNMLMSGEAQKFTVAAENAYTGDREVVKGANTGEGSSVLLWIVAIGCTAACSIMAGISATKKKDK